MAFALKLRRSAGVRVTAAVHALIRQGDAARDRRDWRAAADAYGRALAADPGLAHIYLQHGHMLKEAGDLVGARAAYDHAVRLTPRSAEPHVHLGHVARLSGDHEAACRHFLDAMRLDPAHADAAAEVHREVGRAEGPLREAMIATLRANAASWADEGEARRFDPDTGPAIVFDISDLIAFYAHDRLPTGIQRVQIETILAALDGPGEVRICCFIEGREDWLEVPPALFRRLTALSVEGGERHEAGWIAALNALRLVLTLAPGFDFPGGAWLVNLGTGWWLRNYFLYVRHAKATRGIRYVPFVHDFIPVMAPEHCVAGLTEEFTGWTLGVFAHADAFLVNSEATKRDLLTVAETLGHPVDPADVRVVRLDADFRDRHAPTPDPSALAKFDLTDRGYALFVSTIESRKGHAVALEAWARLIGRHGAAAVPPLVCVGRRGWLNDAVYARLAADPVLAGRVVMLDRVSDADLALLYDRCAFTLYPSLYEGWGLPVTEALCRGRPVIASDSSSLPEAGGDFACYVPAGEATPLADAVERMAFDAAWRAGWERRIAEGFRARDWRAIARQIAGEVADLAASRRGGPALSMPQARMGRWHSLARRPARRIWPRAASAEIFRAGLGWLWPDAEGCWTRPGGGRLAIGIAGRAGALRVRLKLRNPTDDDLPVLLRVRGGASLSMTLRGRASGWLTFDYPPADDGDVLALHLSAETAAPVALRQGQAGPAALTASVGLVGFHIQAADDAAAHAAFLEAAALDALDTLDAYAPPPPDFAEGPIDWSA